VARRPGACGTALHGGGAADDPDERDAIVAAGGLVSTPRSAKRLVNSYRLLRAGLHRTDLDRLTGSRVEYPAVIVLLALLVGFPAQAARVLEVLLSRGQPLAESFPELVKECATAHTDVDRSRDPITARMTAAMQAVGAPSDLEPYRHWASRVARFSFRTGVMLLEHA
jgi:hypothetical protein